MEARFTDGVPDFGIVGIPGGSSVNCCEKSLGQRPVHRVRIAALKRGAERICRYQQTVTRRKAVDSRACPQRECTGGGVAFIGVPGSDLSGPPQGEREASVDRDCARVCNRRRIPRRPPIILLTLKKRPEGKRRTGADRRRANGSNTVSLSQLPKNVDGEPVGRLFNGGCHRVLFG